MSKTRQKAATKSIAFPPNQLAEIERLFLSILRRAPSGCWEWTRSLDKDGYGSFRHYRAHRVAYELFRGPTSGARCVCHSCDNPACCNPMHLFLGDDAVNSRDRDRKDRGPRGERNHFARLDVEMVRRIRGLLASGMNQRAAARECGLSRGTVQNVATGRAWRHVA